MSNWIYLEIAISMALIYFLVSILCTSLTEMIARWFSLRARTMKDGILKMLNGDNDLYTKMLEHPLFKGLSPNDPDSSERENPKIKNLYWWDEIGIGDWHPFRKNIKNNDKREEKKIGRWWDFLNICGWYFLRKNHFGPSEIPPSTFSKILVDNLLGKGKSQTQITNKNGEFKNEINNIGNKLVSGINALPQNSDVQKVLSSYLTEAKTKSKDWSDAVNEFRQSVETWFDESQKRVTGWYRRKTQLIVLGVALIICFAVNLDTFSIATAFYNNPELRQAAVNIAVETANKTSAEAANLTYNDLQKKLSDLNLPIGWKDVVITSNETTIKDNNTTKIPLGWPLKIVGILFTAVAASMGSGFWYDIVKKLVGLRSGGKTSDSADDKTSTGSGGKT